MKKLLLILLLAFNTAGAETLIAPVIVSPKIVGGTGGEVKVQTIDGVTTVDGVTTIKFTNGAVTDNGDKTVNVVTGAGGDVSGGAASTDSELVIYSGIGGKTIKRSNTVTGIVKATAGVIGTTDIPLTSILWVAKNGNDANSCAIALPCLTIGAANTAATSGTTIMVMPGTYTENLTLKAGVSIQGQQARTAIISGNMTASYSGTSYLHSVDLQAAAGSVLTISGANATNLQIDDTHIDGLSGASDTVSYTNTHSSSIFNADNGAITAAVTTTAKAINVATGSAGHIYLEDVSVTDVDSLDHVAIAVAGSVVFTHNADQVQGTITVANTASYTGVNLKLIVGTVASLTTNSSGASSLINVLHYTSAHPVVTGAGVFAQGLNVFAGTGYDFNATLNGGLGAIPIPASAFQLHASTLQAAGGLASGLMDGTIEHDVNHLYVDIGTTRYQLDQQFNGTQNTSGTAANVTGIVAIANGGTNASDTATARTNLGLGTAAVTAATAYDVVGAAAAVTVTSIGAVPLNGALGTPTSGTATNLSGTATGLTAGTVTNGVYTTGAGTVYLAPAGSGAALTGMQGSQIGMMTYSGGGTASVGSSTANDVHTAVHSKGIFSYGGSGLVVANGTTAVGVAAGSAVLRVTNSKTANLEYVQWAAVTNHSITTLLAIGDVYVYVDYTHGAAIQYSNTDPDPTNTNETVLHLADVRANAALTAIGVIHDTRAFVGNHAEQWAIMHDGVFGTPVSGQYVATSGTGAIKVAVTAGTFYSPGFNNHAEPAFDTNVTDTFTYWYQTGANTWTQVASQTALDVTNYDNGTALVALGGGKYGINYVYRDLSGNVRILYGQGSYNTAALALAAAIPPVPTDLTAAEHAYLMGAITFVKAATVGVASDMANRIGNSGAAQSLAPYALSTTLNATLIDVPATGTGDAIVLTPVTPLGPYASNVGMRYVFVAPGTNTVSPPTVNISGLGAINTTMGSVATPVGDVVSGRRYWLVITSGTSANLSSWDSVSPFGDTMNGSLAFTAGGITGATVNGNTVTTGTGTLTLGAGSTLATTATNSITLTSTGGTNVTLPVTGTLATLSGSETLATKTLTTPVVNGYNEGVSTPTVTAGAVTLDVSVSTFQKVVTAANTTITLPSPVAGKSYTVQVCYGGTHTITWAGGGTLAWPAATAPTATSVSGKCDLYTFASHGATYTFGADAGRNFTGS